MLTITEEHVDRAFKIARWYGRRARRAEISDLESAALEGLAKAARDWEPEPALSPELRRRRRKRAFWSFAFVRILGEMKDELRRFDHLTRDQRAMVAEEANGDLALDPQELSWINPEAPMALDAVVCVEGENPRSIVDLVEEPRDAIEEFELRDAFCRASAELPVQQRFVVVKREIEGFTNIELADAFDVTEGRASQIRGAALEQMRDQIGDSFLDAA